MTEEVLCLRRGATKQPDSHSAEDEEFVCTATLPNKLLLLVKSESTFGFNQRMIKTAVLLMEGIRATNELCFSFKKNKKYARRLSCACTVNFSCSWKLRRVWREAQCGVQMHWMIIASCKHQPRYFNAHLKQQYARIGRTYGGVVIKNYGISLHQHSPQKRPFLGGPKSL